ncbi:MAG TPA: HAD-IB family phosphatase [Clostridiales bacterium]|nr:HAD-IB family phosphatase [Clostridiales bacterium]HRT81982.1 HAD-IB family phosphatase [Oscillospiraceae bacterium]
MKVDLYDFDKTVCPNDTAPVFWFYCLRKHPVIARHIPKQTLAFIKFLLGKYDTTQFKEISFCFLADLDAERVAEKFWERRIKKIYPFFLPQNRDLPAVVVSASAEFMIKPVCDALGVHKLIGTQMDPKTGKIKGKNCRGPEKAQRIKNELEGYTFVKAYSDSLKNDGPMLDLALESYLANKGKLTKIK